MIMNISWDMTSNPFMNIPINQFPLHFVSMCFHFQNLSSKISSAVAMPKNCDLFPERGEFSKVQADRAKAIDFFDTGIYLGT